MSEAESAHGKLSKVDREWNSTRFMVLFIVTVAAAFTIIFVISSIKPFGPPREADFSYEPLAHDLVQHTVETSAL